MLYWLAALDHRDCERTHLILKITHQIFIAILPFNEVTVDVVEVEAARESLVRGSVWGMARERMQDNDEEKLQNSGSSAFSMKSALLGVQAAGISLENEECCTGWRPWIIEIAGEPI